jgi:hypothetical protein
MFNRFFEEIVTDKFAKFLNVMRIPHLGNVAANELFVFQNGRILASNVRIRCFLEI